MKKTAKSEYESGVEYVIYSKKKNAVWAGGPRMTFLTHAQAKTELDRQMARLPEDVRARVDWAIEERSWHTEIIKKSSDDGFEGF